MPNAVIVLVVCGLWVEGVCGGALLDRFTERLVHKTPRYNRMGPQHRRGEDTQGSEALRYQRPENTRVRSIGDQRLVHYRIGDTPNTSSRPTDNGLVQFKRGGERNSEDKRTFQYTNTNNGDQLQEDFHEIITERFGNGEEHDRVRKDQSDFRTTPSSWWQEQFWTVQAPRAVPDQQACVSVAAYDATVVRAAVILPNSSDYTTSLGSVLPVLRLAQQEVRRRQLLPSLTFQWLPRDDRCDAVHAQIGTFEAVKQNVHVFFGPACEYSVAPVARMIKFWHTPLLTTGALTFDFSRDKRDPESEYHLLLRTGMLSFQDLAKFIISLLDKYGWDKVMLIYEKDGCRQISGKHTCKLMMETLVEFFKRRGLHYGSYDLEKNAADGLLLNLRRELGYQYNSE